MIRKIRSIAQSAALAALAVTPAAGLTLPPVIPEPGALGLFATGAAVVVIAVRLARRR